MEILLFGLFDFYCFILKFTPLFSDSNNRRTETRGKTMASDAIQGMALNQFAGNGQVTQPQAETGTHQVGGGTNANGKGSETRSYPPFTKKQLDDLVSQANQILTPDMTEVHYVLYEKLNKYYVQVEDTLTHEVIREIPPKKFMDMYAAIAEKLGLIVNKHV